MTLLLSLFVATQLQPRSEFSVAWQSIESEIRENYFGRVTRKEEMEERLAIYKLKAVSAKSRDEFANTISTMLGEFKDSHFYFFTKDDELFYGLDGARHARYDGGPVDRFPYPSLGFWFWRHPEGYRVWSITFGGEAYKLGVRRLDLFITCEGKPFHPIRSLRGKVGKTLVFGLRRAGKLIQLELPVKSGSFWRDLTAAATARSFTYQGRKFLYMWPSHMYGRATPFDLYGERPSDIEGVVLDLRDGLGGYFQPHVWPFVIPDAEVRWSVPGTVAGATHGTGLRVPTVILVNRMTLSAREFVAAYVRKQTGAKLVGEPTAGAVLGAYVTETQGWWSLMIPAQVFSLDGIVFERNPLQPDVVVKDETGEDGSDAILEKGVEVLNDLVAAGK